MGALINVTKVKEYLKESNMRYSQELKATLEKRLKELLTDAVQRAASNGRSTVKSRDL